uniref:Major sperm protein n=1 Tax=Haemonchus placei TaxID=6290 RepID=A0A0N4W365_HAEPC
LLALHVVGKDRTQDCSPITHPYNSNDAHIWTTKDPDLELVEPRILVSINRNYLVYGRKFGRPPQTHKIILVNHGENPVAFKVLTTDNYAYFVNQVFGVIPGRHLHAIPHLRAPNQFTLQVFRRPYDCFCDEQHLRNQLTIFRPRKDKLFILLAPVFSFSIPPASVFHHEGAYEKLRICLEYTGMPVDPDKGILPASSQSFWTKASKTLLERSRSKGTGFMIRGFLVRAFDQTTWFHPHVY